MLLSIQTVGKPLQCANNAVAPGDDRIRTYIFCL